MDEEGTVSIAAGAELSGVVIPLLKGVIYRDGNPAVWAALLRLQARVRDYVAVMGLELNLDEAEGYAFLRSAPQVEEGAVARLPRLIPRRPLSYPVSLLLALLRKKLVEFDAASGETRLILTRRQIVELIQVFLPASTNETRIIDQVETHLNKIVELGFARRLKPVSAAAEPTWEVLRIIKAFVDANWLAELERRLSEEQSGMPVEESGVE
jgi:hypothetical protein